MYPCASITVLKHSVHQPCIHAANTVTYRHLNLHLAVMSVKLKLLPGYVVLGGLCGLA